MDQLFDAAIKNKLIRDEYVLKYNQMMESKIQLTKEMIKEIQSLVPLTDTEINDFGMNNENEYDIDPKKQFDKQFKSIPWNLNKSLFGKIKESQDEISARRIKKLNFKNFTAAKNYQRQYYHCVKTIKKFEIDIYGIKKDPTQYLNRRLPCYGKSGAFEFHCKKNHYEFKINFFDDNDCVPGMLLIRKVINTETNKEYELHCDLYCQNASDIALSNFLYLLECENLDEYIQLRYGHIFRLPNLLINAGYEISYPEMNIVDTITINDHDRTIFINITTDKGSCSIIPSPDKSKKKNILILSPHLDVNDAYRFYDSPIMNLEYNSDNDFPKLTLMIHDYIEFQNGNYGYLNENGVFQNEKNIIKYLNKFMESDDFYNKIKFWSKKIKKSQLFFDINIIYNSDTNPIVLYKDHIDNIDYIHDEYKIRMWYDYYQNKNKCFISFKGKCCNFTKVSNDYHQDATMFDYKTYDYGVIDICPKIIFEASFDECFENYLKKFLNTISMLSP
jgi:hypothetical protein